MNLIFASNNKGKLAEIQEMVPGSIRLITLREAGITEEIPEPYATFRENAHAKASYVFRATGMPCFAEDSGLVVPALGGAPGVFSARYAGTPSSDEANNALLLKNIKAVEDKSAYYQSVICLVLPQGIHYFEGRCPGSLTTHPRGNGGFGYDPLFIPEGWQLTFAEIPLEEKNKISHRAGAMAGFLKYLTSFNS